MSMNNSKIPIRVGRGARLADAPKARAFKVELDKQFDKHSHDLVKFAIGHDHTKHALEAVWRVYVPEKEFFTLKGTISKTCLDATNSVKLMEDGLVRALKIDDSQIVQTTVLKIPTNGAWCVSLELTRIQRPEVVRLNIQK